jgi:SPP1 gp7 family putative phage head morphogenesis protein
MSTRREMVDSTTRHQIYLQRYAGAQTKQILAFVQQLEDNVLTKARYVKMLAGFKAFADSLTNYMVGGVISNLQDLAQYEADFTKRIIDQSANTDVAGFETVVPTVDQLNAAAFTSIMDTTVGTGIGSYTVQDALENYGAKLAGGIVQLIRQGYAVGDPTDKISSDIQDYVGEKITQSQATAVSRTITNYVANSAKDTFYEENDDLITGYQVVATLDDRTTLECAALDGEVFDKDNFESPPYHWNCRSTYIGVIDPQYSISNPGTSRPSRGEDGYEEVSAGTTYNAWLKTQSSEFQDSVLGKERGQMFRDGASVQSFVDHNYQPYTIDELKAMDDEHN